METQLVTKTLRPGSLEEHSFKSCVAIDTAAKFKSHRTFFPFSSFYFIFPFLQSFFLPLFLHFCVSLVYWM